MEKGCRSETTPLLLIIIVLRNALSAFSGPLSLGGSGEIIKGHGELHDLLL